MTRLLGALLIIFCLNIAVYFLCRLSKNWQEKEDELFRKKLLDKSE